MATTQKKPYLDHKFLGVRSFVELLEEAGRAYSIIGDGSADLLFSGQGTFLNSKDDTVRLGKVPKDGEDVFFLEFGLMIAPQVGARAYIVFIFDHHPNLAQMEETAADIESIVNSRLDELGKTVPDGGSGNPGGKSIN